MNAVQTKFQKLHADMNGRYAERDIELFLAMMALITGEHVINIGPPGTAKSMMVEDLAKALGVTYMRKLFSKQMAPEEVFGPYDLRLIKEGKFRRVSTDRTAQVAKLQFWDEIFKTSSAVRNGLLTVMNERLFFDGDDVVEVPLITVFAASNELPDDSEESGAFWDRFLYRRFVTYIKDPSAFVRMLRAQPYDQPTVITEAELYAAQDEVQEVRIPQSVEEAILDLRATLDLEGIVVSDRRWKQSLKAVQGSAWFHGRDTADDGDMSVLQHVLWDDPQNVKTVMRAILSHANPIEQDVVGVIEAIESIEASLREEVKKAAAAATPQARSALREQGIEWFTKLEGLGRQLKELQEKAEASGRSSRTVNEAMQRLEAVGVLIGSDAMGLDKFSKVKDQMRQRIFG